MFGGIVWAPTSKVVSTGFQMHKGVVLWANLYALECMRGDGRTTIEIVRGPTI